MLKYTNFEKAEINSNLNYVLLYYNIKGNNKNKSIANLCNLMSKKSLRELETETSIGYNTLRRAFAKATIPLTIKRSSAIHLKMKRIIKQILNRNTESEKPLTISGKKYVVDEYCADLNLAIEIDGAWCHNESYDIERDIALKSIGIETVRIPANSTEEEIKIILNEYA